MFESVVFALALALPNDPTPPIAKPAHSVSSTSDREWAVNRPTRGAHANAVIRAATVPNRWHSFAACVLDRESGGTLDRWQSGVGALNASGAAGRWQFMPNWRHGLPYMIRDRLIQFGMPKKEAAKVRVYLSKLYYIHKYPGVYQDIGFNEVVERGGSFHWNGGSHSC
jgi:hypothetical protein